MIHISANYYSKENINSYNWKISFMYNGISRFGVPIFFMISGALFLNRDISYKKMFNKYIKRLIINLVVWSFIYSIFNNNIYNFKLSIKKIIIKFCLSHFHLWYIFTTIGFYMIVPFLREITKREQLLEYFLILSFIFTFIIPNCNYFISSYSNKIHQIIKSIYVKMNMNFINGFNFYFMFGFYLNNIKNMNINKLVFIYVFRLIGLYFTVILLYRLSIFKKEKILIFFRALNLNILAYSTSIFIIAKIYFNNLNSKSRDFIKKISNYSFGIYLIHPLIINKFYKFQYYFSFMDIFYKIPIISLIIYIISLIISIIIKFIPFIGNYIL